MSPQCCGYVAAQRPFRRRPPLNGAHSITVIFQPIYFKFEYKVDRRMGNDVATPSERSGAIRGGTAPFPAAPPLKWRPFNNSVIFQPICFKFEYKVDRRMRNDVATLSERSGAICGGMAPFPAAPPSKWRPINNSVIFQPICFKFEYKVDHRMGNDVATPPQCYNAVRGVAAPFPAATPSKWRPFNNSVIFQPICSKFG